MTLESNTKYPYCNGTFPSDVQEVVNKFSKEQTDSFKAMHTLLCSYKSPYGIGEEFYLQTKPESDCEPITIAKTIGEGGSKKAVLFNDGRVAMFPNMDVDNVIRTAQWWPGTVKNEALMTDFLEKIEVPALNRKQAFLTIPIPGANNENSSNQLPILLSDSFEQYASRGWFVYDQQTPQAMIASDSEKWDFELEQWKYTVIPLLIDIWKLVYNNITPGTDSRNLVLIKTESDSFALRYFGFDFGGKYGDKTPPPLEDAIITIEWDQNKCSKVSKLASDMIKDFVFYRLYEKASYKEVDNFARLAGNELSSCEFLKEAIFGIDTKPHVEI